ncbi:MAG: type I-E CRISPR-associated protein Cas6/Cse3/CasE [Burkholderiaceae bacterium]|jgi:CRISPR system Cascade subunit CasE|nr:type I-E CRISPR-associated protein Cas6/Cse3/CasE [Burkholderiaceae bacterium]
MHFSLIQPAPGHEREAAHDWIAGAYQQHQWLWRFLPGPPGTARRFVFRRHDVEGLPRFYVVSDTEPRSPVPNWAVRSKPYAPRLAVGDVLQFDLRANPVVTTRGADGRARRHDAVMQEKKRLLAKRGLARWADWGTPDRPALPDLVRRTCAAWLQARAARLGIAIDADALQVEGYARHRGKSDELRFSTVDFSGRLQVVDPDAFREALFRGVGHGKAFGCGLLLVRALG